MLKETNSSGVELAEISNVVKLDEGLDLDPNTRIIYPNDAQRNIPAKYMSNSVRTSKYRIWNFLPLFLWNNS